MMVSQMFAGRLRWFLPVAGFVLASATGGFAQDRDILLTGASPCATCCPTPRCCPTSPSTAGAPGTDTPAPPLLDPDVAFSQSSLGLPQTVAFAPGGYIDDAVPRTMFRTRFDASYGIDHADRAEFLNTTWRAFGGKFRNPPQGFPDGNLDTQAFSLYYEHALNSDTSVFAEVQAVLNNPTRSGNHGGFGDMQVGFKRVLRSDECSILTFQLKNYIPTGNANNWLTAGHYSIEPGLLYARQLSQRATLVAELRDWISVDGADFGGDDYAGNVLRYGAGLTYRLVDRSDWSATPIVELVGWSVLDGLLVENPSGGAPVVGDATGDTIVNLKIGTRFELGRSGCCQGGRSHSVYAGWGHSLTGDRWYRDMLRLEYRIVF